MAKRILLVQGHPDPQQHHWCNARARAYCQGAEAAGHPVQQLEVAALDFPLLERPAIATS